MHRSFENKGSPSRLQDQSWGVAPGVVCALSSCGCDGGCFQGSHSPQLCAGVAPSKSHCTQAKRSGESFLWIGGREQKGLVLSPGGTQGLQAPQSCPSLAGPVLGLDLQLCSTPWIPDEGKVIAASHYNQLATSLGELCCIVHTLYPQIFALENGRLGWSSAYHRIESENDKKGIENQ